MKNKFRSSCPIASALDLIGDKWSLLIIRDMILGGKKTFKEFSDSQEKIAPGILSSRLKLLESLNLLTKRKLSENKKENIYLLTESGIDLVPMIAEIVLWSDRNVKKLNPIMSDAAAKGLKADKTTMIQNIQNNYRQMVQKMIG